MPGRLLLVIAFAGIAIAANADDADRGAALLQPFKQELRQALLDGLEEGPAAAIEVCKLQAPAIAKMLAVGNVAMGRSSHRLRNPDNVAPEWVSPVLAAYLEAESDRAPVVVPLPGERTGYIEPIVMQPLCLICHGQDLSPDVAARIEAEYPHDRATGFSPGDLRGVFWIEFPAGP